MFRSGSSAGSGGQSGADQRPSNQPCRTCPLRDRPGLVAPDATQREWIERQRAGERAIARGEEVLRQGAPGDRMFTVLDGVLMRYRLLEDGRRQVVNVMFPGDLVGLQAAFDGEISHGVTALTDVRLCVFPRDRFMDLVTAHPRFAYDVIWLCAREEDALEQHLVALGQRPARERVAYLALWLVERGLQTGLVPEVDGAAMLPVTITQGQVADMLGLSLVHTNRTMQALRKAGQVDWSGAGIRVPDLASVRALVGFDPHGLPKRPYI
ncbi:MULTISPECIES: Crp/Fnr family transcriptional regulator [unclassified Novosphingobium]|uniref:cyclic nucleotide-binding domain-containing protein n=1 Tax=unclassified Novosphingobium TaxID=2644732 RepID=UPI001444A933|nr:CRP-like cAMP-binding protein [Novosphingobium sp. SG720]NMN05507.1 CRP-like cAMP-binding protein [Novosphingobium sp. SG919]NMN88134.1 CRP-like cAMP-binding protein [Novosphingobium sp. SG916]